MNCHELDLLFENRGDQRLPEAAERHLSTCAACRQLLTVLESARSLTSSAPVNAAPANPSLPLDFLENLAPVRPMPRPPALIFFLILSAALICAAAIAWWGRAGWGAQTSPERLILFGTVVVALFASAYNLSVEMIPGSKPSFDWRWVGAGTFAAFLLTTLIGFHRTYPFNMRAIHMECFGRGLLIAAAVLLLVFVATRRGVFLQPLKVSVTIAGLIASAALLVLTSYCPILSWPHVLVAHLGAVAVTIAAAIVVGELAE